MVEQKNSPFARVSNGYDPGQVAAFAAEALSWKKELVALRAEVASATKHVERYESVIGTIEDVEREAAEIVEAAERKAAGLVETAEIRASEIVEEAEDEAARILEMARNMAATDPGVEHSPVTEQAEAEPEVSPEPTPNDAETGDGESWLNPELSPPEIPDLVEQIFEPIEPVELTEAEVNLERRAAAAANLWKRRGVIAPSE